MDFVGSKSFIIFLLLSLVAFLSVQLIFTGTESALSTSIDYGKVSLGREDEQLSSESKNKSKEKEGFKYSESEASKPLASSPSVIRGVYVTSWSAMSKGYLMYLDNLFTATSVNAVVIDVKDFSGNIAYNSKVKKVEEYKTIGKTFFDANSLVKYFHDRGIYAIARVNIFNDVALAKARPDLAIYSKSKSLALSTTAVTGGTNQSGNVLWKDSSGLHWLDPASEEVWSYNIEIAQDLMARGFDEVNFDYIRFPSDGDIKDTAYPIWNEVIPKQEVIKSFFHKIRESLPESLISIDLFGQTTKDIGDMGIGQSFKDSLGYFDYVCPMVYPSHYAKGFIGYENPAEHPYEIIKDALDGAFLKQLIYKEENPDKKIAKIRPWLQSFNLGAVYDASMVEQEIQATRDALSDSYNGFLLWNPSNLYIKESIESKDIAPN